MNGQSIKQFLTSATGRLTASYLIVIMGMSLGYSVVLYSASVRELQRQLPPAPLRQVMVAEPDTIAGRQISDLLRERAAEGRRVLLSRLILLNLLTFVAGGALSYYLARRTLRPIEENMEAQSQFISDASHELRTPLTTLQTTNEVALRDSTLNLTRSKELLQQNIEEVAKLQALTNSLLTLAKTDEGAITMERVSLQEVANDAMNRVVRLAQAKHISIDDQVKPVHVVANRQCLAEAVVVLLDNAIKYGPEGSKILLEGGIKAKQAFISVRDEGPGIRPYDLRRIFDRFYRADQSRSTRHVPGHGIGLSLAKKLVEQQGGDIQAVSKVGKGSVFTIVLPRP